MIYPNPCTNDQPERQASVTLRTAACEPAILVVEDDAGVRRFICTLLSYATTAIVIDAADPHAALSRVRKLGRPVDVLISDIDLCSRMNGFELAQELAMANPSMKVLLISGSEYPPCTIPTEWRFLAKPFTIQTLLDRVSAFLPSPPAGRNFE